MGSLQFDGVLFQIFSLDHLPRHAHGFYAETEVIVDLLPEGARLSSRRDAVKPKNAKTSDVRKIVQAAQANYLELNRLWELTHGAD